MWNLDQVAALGGDVILETSNRCMLEDSFMVEKHSFGATCGSTCIYNAEVIIWLNAVKGIGEFF